MTDIVVDGQTQIWVVTTISSLAAPTVAEITAGVKIGPSLRADGIENFSASPTAVDTTSIESLAETSVPGRVTFGDAALVLKKQASSDTAYTALGTPYTNCFIVMRFGVAAATAVAAAQKVDIYTVQTGLLTKIIEQGQVVRYRVPTPLGAVPSYDIAVAA